MRAVDKAIESGGRFSSVTIKSVFRGLLEYFIYDYWHLTTKSSNSYSNERIDRVREILLVAFRIYGKLVGMLSLPQFIRTIRDLIMTMGSPRKGNDQILKIVCSCLNNMTEDIHDVLEVINQEHEERHKKAVQSSYLNSVLSVFRDQRRI